MSSMKRRQELSGIHVVVIDDDDDARTIMKMVLEAHGDFVMVAASARDGLAALGQVAAMSFSSISPCRSRMDTGSSIS